MDIISIGDLGVISTDKEMSLIINDHIHGPFPKDIEMYDMLIHLCFSPNDEELMKRISKKRKIYLANRSRD